MSGSGGYKHRLVAAKQRKTQKRRKALASLARAKALFEAKGQAWDPANNAVQLAALNHDARRFVSGVSKLRA